MSVVNFLCFSYFQNIDCGYMLEPPGQEVLTSTHNLCFGAKIRKIGVPLQTPVFNIKVRFMVDLFHGHVFLMSLLFCFRKYQDSYRQVSVIMLEKE